MDTADTHAVGLKLPVFWADHPRVWLQQAEAQFAVRNVTADNTKYHYVVAALDQAAALCVIDVLEDSPQHNKYDNLKRCLTDIFGLSRRQRVDQLLDIGLHSMGDSRQSQRMVEMLALLGSHKPCMLFERIFLRCMPEHIRLQLATSSVDDLQTLAKTADELWQAKEQSAVVFASNTRTKRSATRKPATTTSSGESPARDRDMCFYRQRYVMRPENAYSLPLSRETTEPAVNSRYGGQRNQSLLMFVWNTLIVSLTVSTTMPLQQDPLGVNVAGSMECSEWALFNNVPCGLVALSAGTSR